MASLFSRWLMLAPEQLTKTSQNYTSVRLEELKKAYSLMAFEARGRQIILAPLAGIKEIAPNMRG